MHTSSRHIAPYSIRIFLMAFWLYVALDKLWDLDSFHRALLRQPFPNWWAAVLFWFLPLAELGIAASLLRSSISHRRTYLASSFLLFIFTVYIALGVFGFYDKRPCGCASVFSGMTWEWHLVVNGILLSLSILGWYLSGPTAPMDAQSDQHAPFHGTNTLTLLIIRKACRALVVSFRLLFPRRFAPFPGRPAPGY